MAARGILAAIGLVLFTACGPKYGGATTLSLSSTPSRVRVYIIPLLDWERNGGESILERRSSLERYHSVITPKAVFVSEQAYVLVFACKDGATYQHASPQRGADNSFSEDCGT